MLPLVLPQKVIKEIYKKYNKPPKDTEELDIPRFIDLLKEHHDLRLEDDEIVDHKLDAFNPFSRMLVKRLNGIVELDQYVAFIFSDHILFFERDDNNMHVHFKKEKKSLFSRLFGRKKD